MNILEVIIAKFWVKILDLLTYKLNSKVNKITYISYVSNKLPKNMKLISDSIKNLDQKYEEVYLTIKYSNSIFDKIRYVIEIAKQIYHIKTSSVVIIDGNNFVISNIDKKNTKVIQIWHACGAIKKFGNDFKRKYDIKNYDYIITSSSKSKAIMASAFGVKEEQVLPLGYAMTDILFNKNKINKYKKAMYSKYPEFKSKKVILYAPTFRGEGIYDKDFLDIDLDKIAKILGKEYILLYKKHPVINIKHRYLEENVYDVSHESLYKLFSITDILVSDFSAIIYDFSILEKNMIFYVPDLKEYKQNRGLYVNYETFVPGDIVYNEDELAKNILEGRCNIKRIREFKSDFFDFLDGKSAKRIAEFIDSVL